MEVASTGRRDLVSNASSTSELLREAMQQFASLGDDSTIATDEESNHESCESQAAPRPPAAPCLSGDGIQACTSQAYQSQACGVQVGGVHVGAQVLCAILEEGRIRDGNEVTTEVNGGAGGVRGSNGGGSGGGSVPHAAFSCCGMTQKLQGLGQETAVRVCGPHGSSDNPAGSSEQHTAAGLSPAAAGPKMSKSARRRLQRKFSARNQCAGGAHTPVERCSAHGCA